MSLREPRQRCAETSFQADIWMLPSMERIHAAIGKGKLDDASTILGSNGRGANNPTGAGHPAFFF